MPGGRKCASILLRCTKYFSLQKLSSCVYAASDLGLGEDEEERKPPWSSEGVKIPRTEILGKLGVATVWEEMSNTQVDFLLYERQQPKRSNMLHRRFLEANFVTWGQARGKKPYHRYG